MGYESRVIIYHKHSNHAKDFYGEAMAELKLSCCDNDFLALFQSEFKGHLFDAYGCDKEITRDKYDAPLKYAPFNKVYKYLLDNAMRSRYRRYDMLLSLMNAIRIGWASSIGDILIIHYGY